MIEQKIRMVCPGAKTCGEKDCQHYEEHPYTEGCNNGCYGNNGCEVKE